MKHLGDITKISGAEAAVVDCIIGGSPCQDLSIAGKREGLAGKRSGLFMEQIRIVKEMRQHERDIGRTGQHVRPRYMVWENVPGAFSSNKGKDFCAVLEETIRVAEPEAPPVPVPEKGWPTSGCLWDEMGKWSVAWRVLDAQFWGVPQRRRRIALVADFGGLSAGEILFVRKSVSGDTDEGKQAWKETAGDAGEGSGTTDCEGAIPINTMIATRYKQLGRGTGFGVGEAGDPQFTISAGHEHAVAYTMKIRSGCEGGGKGALIQTDKSATLSTLQDQTLFQPVVYGIGSYHSNAWKSENPNSGVYEADIAKTLDHLNCGYPACNQGGMAVVEFAQNQRDEDVSFTLDATDRHGVMCMTPWDAQSQRVYDGDGIWPTLSARESSGLNREAVLCLNDQGGNVMGVCYDVSGTLRAQEHGHQPSILDMSHACDVIRNCGDVVPNLQARMGTGGNQVPLVAYSIGNGQVNQSVTEEVVGILNTMHDQQAVICPNIAHTLRGVGNDPHREDAASYPIQNMRVRRLTPMECERLQGFPDGWTDIGEWVDSKGKKHKSADAPRYKALWNSIAIPPWKWVLKRLCACYERDATMASLFDGIGGFPYIWEQLNGKGTCLWASEIEEFPIAVTKLRFRNE